MPNLVGVFLTSRRRTAAEAIKAYQAAGGHLSNPRDRIDFLAVEWVLPYGGDASVGLEEFKQQSRYPESDLDEQTYQEIKDCLERWARQQLRAAA